MIEPCRQLDIDFSTSGYVVEINALEATSVSGT